jgi:hypothetical protein
MSSFDFPVSFLPGADELNGWIGIPFRETDVAGLLKFPALCDTRRLITVSKRDLLLDPDMSHMNPIHFYHPISLKKKST